MRFHNIEANNIENGTGIRVLLWVSGCFHKCEGCQNPITHDPTDGVEYTEESEKELLDALKPNWVSGITFTGGDPLCYYFEDTLKIIKKIREVYGNTKTIWLYTGYTIEELIDIAEGPTDRSKIFRSILEELDVLCEGRWKEDLASKEYHWVGSSNQRVIDMKKTIQNEKLTFLEKDQEKLCSISSLRIYSKVSSFARKLKYNIK